MLYQVADSIHGSVAGDRAKALPGVAVGPTRNRWRMLLTTTPSRTSPTRGSRRLSQSYSWVTRLHTDSCCEGVTAGQQRRARHGGIGRGGGKSQRVVAVRAARVEAARDGSNRNSRPRYVTSQEGRVRIKC